MLTVPSQKGNTQEPMNHRCQKGSATPCVKYGMTARSKKGLKTQIRGLFSDDPIKNVPRTNFIPQSRTRRTRRGGASDIPLHICTSVEGVERKQLALTEQRAWQELTSRLEAEWKRYERQCSRSLSR
ncbi:uncharacterized protein TM35_000211320 [Trypanosoma theileri]|uniref:Tbingi protein n=1 Tax=Trypanosoma theileri TaxID=67003 RepID=A0A1X0NS46_9TRYP|nr:uncharacterized protein TM35_000211320 [Trypanosoma theileri]ORC87526.1 hypothetical protein TM35_000211320 [Trypanosoma theileri]